MASTSAPDSPSRSATSIFGNAVGSALLETRAVQLIRRLAARSRWAEVTPPTPAMVLTATGQIDTQAAMTISIFSDWRKMMTAIGMKEMAGMERSTSTDAIE